MWNWHCSSAGCLGERGCRKAAGKEHWPSSKARFHAATIQKSSRHSPMQVQPLAGHTVCQSEWNCCPWMRSLRFVYNCRSRAANEVEHRESAPSRSVRSPQNLPKSFLPSADDPSGTDTVAHYSDHRLSFWICRSAQASAAHSSINARGS